MSKAKILENLGEGQYKIEVLQDRSLLDDRVKIIDTKIAELDIKIEAAEAVEKGLLMLEKVSLKKEKELYSKIVNREVVAWAADYETELSGVVGIANTPDEPGRFVNIQPAGGAYNESRDGNTFPILVMQAKTAYYNRALLPGVQRWKPQWRYGVITAINSMDGTCSVALTSAYSSQQGLPINPEKTKDTKNDITRYGKSIFEPSGWESFKERYHDHPIAKNDQPGSKLTLSEFKLDQLKEINAEINSTHEYESDRTADTVESWNILGEGEKGDCEDFVLTKMDKLIKSGWDPKDLHLTGCTVMKDDGSIGGHAVLHVNTDQGTLILDNGGPDIMFPGDPKIANYLWTSQLNAGEWESIASGTVIEDVPVEYMDCNEKAFKIGDYCLISFSGSWETPKVIGFQKNPRSCPMLLLNYVISGSYNRAVGVYDFDLDKVFEVSDKIYLGGAVLAPTLMNEDAEDNEEKIYQNLMWTTGGEGTGFDGKDWKMGDDVTWKGFDTKTGELKKTFGWKGATVTSEFFPESIPLNPHKIAYGFGGLWGAHTYGDDGVYWGISVHSLGNKNGRWSKTGTSGDDVQRIYGIGFSGDRLYIVSRAYGLMSWQVNDGGDIIDSSKKANNTNDKTKDLRIYQNEVYVFCNVDHSYEDFFVGVKIFDLGLNLVRSFATPEIPPANIGMGTMAIRSGFVYIYSGGVTDAIYVYTTVGEFVRKINVDFALLINTIN